MQKRETVDIGDFKYEITQLGTEDGSTGFLKIQKIMGEGGNELDKALSSMSPEDLKWFTKIFAKKTRLIKTNAETGKMTATPLDTLVETHFAGDALFDLLQWLAFCLAFNYGFFIKRLTADGASTIAEMVQKAMSSAPQTGESGES